ncbi:unnamed protein product [Amoebophrya sp. A120]|nr:unnamed protein product [Amoebophrya sp. A120]|eukprot:GSA120T00016846001.1
MPFYHRDQDIEAAWAAGAGEGDDAPLIHNEPQRSYQNPYIDQQDVEVAMEDDNASVLSGGADPETMAQTEATLKKSPGPGEGARLSDAKKAAGEVLKKEEDNSSWFLAPLVVVLFITFDTGKILAEGVSTHGTTVNTSIMTNVIQILNMVLAFTLTIIFMGPASGMAAMFDWKRLSAYALPSSMFSLSQVLNLLQNMYISGATRKVFSQLRIPLTALFSMIIMGAGYTTLQWLMIFSITVGVFQFQMMQEPSDLFDSTDVIIGLVLSILTNICAVLGSLFGEKVMKESKKLPFYLQKFQFEVWTFLFGVCGTFLFVPFVAIMMDLCDGHNLSEFNTGKQFVKNWPLTYRAAVYSHGDALTNWNYDATYQDLTDGGIKAVDIPNRMDMAYWSSTADMRTFGQQYGETVGLENDSVNAYDQLNKLQRVMKKRRSKTEYALHDMGERIQFVNRGLAEDFGRMAGHADTQLRKMKGAEAILIDTKFYIQQPFSSATAMQPASILNNMFVSTVGRVRNEEFEALNLFRRDTPALDADQMTRNHLHAFVSGADKHTGCPKPSAYFTLQKDSELNTLDLYNEFAAYNGDDSNPATYYPEGRGGLPSDPTDAEKDRKAKETYQKVLDLIKPAALDIKAKQEALEAAQSASPVDAAAVTAAAVALQEALTTPTPVQASYKFEYAKVQHHQPSDMILKIAYVRTSTLTVETLDKKDANIAKSISKSFNEKIVFKVDSCDKRIDFGAEPVWPSGDTVKAYENRLKAPVEETGYQSSKATCGRISLDATMALQVPQKLTFSASTGPKKDANPREENSKDNKKKKDKEAKAKWDELTDDQKTAKTVKEWDSFFGIADDQQGKTREQVLENKEGAFFSKLKFNSAFYMNDLLQDNTLTKFKYSIRQDITEVNAISGLEIQTYPGDTAAGVKNGCSLAMCNVNDDEWSSNFGYFKSLIKGSRSWRNMKEYVDTDRAENAEFKRNAFAFSELHGYTGSPLPWVYIGPAFFLGVFLNAGQTWMSAYIAKVLSSLWKNICAAISLVLIVLLEKMFIEDSIKATKNDWARIIFGMMGVILTVLVFQMSPKEKKH